MNFVQLPVKGTLTRVILQVEHITAIAPNPDDLLSTLIYIHSSDASGFVIDLHYTTVLNIFKERFNVIVGTYAYPDLPE